MQNRKYPPGHHGREGFVHLWDYLSISMFSPDLSSTVKWSSQTVICFNHRFTKASSNSVSMKLCFLMKSCRSLILAICASLAAVSTVHFSRCSRSLKIWSARRVFCFSRIMTRAPGTSPGPGRRKSAGNVCLTKSNSFTANLDRGKRNGKFAET